MNQVEKILQLEKIGNTLSRERIERASAERLACDADRSIEDLLRRIKAPKLPQSTVEGMQREIARLEGYARQCRAQAAQHAEKVEQIERAIEEAPPVSDLVIAYIRECFRCNYSKPPSLHVAMGLDPRECDERFRDKAFLDEAKRYTLTPEVMEHPTPSNTNKEELRETIIAHLNT